MNAVAHRRSAAAPCADDGESQAGDEQQHRDKRRNGCDLFFVHGGVDRTEVRHFFGLVIGEVGMNKSDDSQNKKQ